MIISYSANHRKKVMDAFNLEARDGYVIEKNTGNPIKDNLDTKLPSKKFIGVRKGSLEFINKDVYSLLKLRKKLSEER